MNGRQQPGLRPGLVVMLLASFVTPLAVAAYVVARDLLERRGWPRWWLAAPGAVVAAVVVWAQGGPGPALAIHFSGLWELLVHMSDPVKQLPMPGSFLVAQVALAVPVGLLSAGVVPRPLEQAQRAEVARTGRRTDRTDRRARTVTARPDVTASLALGKSLGGDLPRSWRAGQYVILPDSAARLSRLYVGQSGQGKTTLLGREVYLAAYAGRRTIAMDGKGDRGFVEALVDAFVAGWQLRHGPASWPTIHLFPDEPLNGWVGDAAALVNRLLGCWVWTVEADVYRQRSTLALRLAFGQPGPPVTSMGELVDRLDPGALVRAWDGHPTEAALARDLRPHLVDVSMRVANLAAAIDGQLDGDRAIGDADLTIVSVPVMASQEDADALFRILMADVAHWASVRKDDQPALLVVDEFSAIAGGRPQAIHVLERGRSAGVPAILAAQSYAGLGNDDERDRIVSAVATLALFGSNSPDELVRLAGTVLGLDAVMQTEDGRWTGRASISRRERGRVDPNIVRELEPGQAVLVARNRAERIQVIPAPRAGNGLALPRRPFAITGRVPRRLRPRQGPSAPAGRPAGVLDPPGPSGVRGHRPPPAGGEQPTRRVRHDQPAACRGHPGATGHRAGAAPRGRRPAGASGDP